MQLSEPVTTLTDYALAAASVGFAMSIRRLAAPHHRVTSWLWCAAFIASAVAAAFGGTRHGFATYLGDDTLRTLWNVTVFAMGACAAFITAAVQAASMGRDRRSTRWLVYGIAITIVGLAIQQSRFPNSPHFNHNDAYHVIQLIGLYCLYRCAETALDRPGISV